MDGWMDTKRLDCWMDGGGGGSDGHDGDSQMNIAGE